MKMAENKWPFKQRNRILALYALSMALTHTHTHARLRTEVKRMNACSGKNV